MRNALLLFHRWVALATSLLILVVAITGSALVFEGAIDRALNPQLWRVSRAASPASLDSIAAHARAAAAGAPVTGVTLSPVDDRATVVQAGALQVFVDPYSAAVNGTRKGSDFNNSLPRRLHVLHTTLMNKGWGSTVVALVTIASLLLTITGVILWWEDKAWRIRWTASWKRVVFDLHHALGIVTSLVLFIVMASGLVIHYEGVSKAIASLDATPRPKPPAQPGAAAPTAAISPDSLAAVARAALPGASVVFLSLPEKATQPFVVAMRFPEDRTPGGRSRVYVDRFRGVVLLAESTRGAQIGTAINNRMRSLHTGDILGKPTEAVWLFAAIVLAMQAVTGVLMWWNGRGARAALARRAALTS